MNVGDVEHLTFPGGEPGGLGGAVALGAVPIATGVIADLFVATLITLLREKEKAKPNQPDIDKYNRLVVSSAQSYLNAADRVCYCIMKGYFPGINWLNEYGEYMGNIVKEESFEQFFGPGTPYVNILALYNTWRNR